MSARTWRLAALLSLALVSLGIAPSITSSGGTATALLGTDGIPFSIGSIDDGDHMCRVGSALAACTGTSIAGSTGATDNAVLRADGTGGSTVQSSPVGIDDIGNVAGVATIDVGSTSTTLSQSSPGNLAVEGNVVYRAGGTDVPLTDGGTGASDRRTAVANLWARPRLRVLYTAQGDAFRSEQAIPSGLVSNTIGVTGNRLYWRNSSSASASFVGWTTFAQKYMYSTGGTYLSAVVAFSSFSARAYFGAASGTAAYTNARTSFGTVKYMGFALDPSSSDTTLQFVTSDGATISVTNTAFTPTAGGWLFLEWYLQGSTITWTAANCTDINCTSYASSATGTHTGSLPSAQTLAWEAVLGPPSGTASLSVDLAWLEAGQY